VNRRITVFTGTRAEYGLMRHMLELLSRWPEVDTHILASGTHLEAAYGNTISEIEQDAFAPICRVIIDLSDNTPAGVCASMGRAIAGYGAALHGLAPDLLVVLGDRYESFCAVAAATVLCLPVAHLYGGETTQGAIDDVFRHAMTKMSHLHFVSCERYRQRVIQLGEEREHVWCVGSAGVENVHTLPTLAEQDVRNYLSLPDKVPYMVATYHPATLDDTSSERHVHLLLDALCAQEGLYYVFTGANADAGGQGINDILRARAATDPRMRFFTSLGVLRYVNAVRYSAGVVGNSSSGVCEAPSLKIPVLDIGDRQKGRERSAAVLHCLPEQEALRDAVRQMRMSDIINIAETTQNPLEKLHTSQNIARILAEHPLLNILHKTFHELPKKN
jgi:UDP-hydrolysing UDP-N-acetyl-D-glucosamine 2-epimerase